MQFDPAQARKNITIKFVDKDFSKFSVYPVVISFFLDYLRLDRALEDVLKIEKVNNSFSGVEYLLTFLSIIFLGIKRIYKADDLLADERQIAKILGIKKERFPSSTRLYNLLSKVNHWDVYRLDKANFAVIAEQKEYLAKKRWLVSDIDQTNKLTEGLQIEKAKPCFDRKRKGKLGLRLSAAQVNGLVFSQKLEPGNVSCIESFPWLLEDMFGKLGKLSSRLKKKRIKDKRIILRIDGGYFSGDTLKQLEEIRKTRRLEFVIRAKKNLALVKQAREEKKPKWQEVNEKIKVVRFPKQQVLKGHNEKYTVLLVRQKQKRIKSKKKRVYHTSKTVEYVLVTTLSSWKTKRILKFYRQRQKIENIFKDFNQSFKANKLPSHKFWGNAMYFQVVSLTSNCTLFLRKYLLANNTKRPHWKPSETDLSILLERY